MKYTDLADLTADQLEALDKSGELKKILEPLFIVTRPEKIERQKPKEQQSLIIQLSPQKQAALRAMEEDGIDMSWMRRKKR